MLPCARSYAGRKFNTLPVARADPSPVEPLLFLYPRWFRVSVQRQSRRATSALSRTREKREDDRKDRKGTPINQPHVDANAAQGACNGADAHHLQVQSRDLRSRAASSHRPKQQYQSQHHDRFVQAPQEQSGSHGARIEKPTRKSRIWMGQHKQVDGVELMRNLLSLQRQVTFPPQTALEVTTAFLLWYTGTVEPNMWIVRVGSGCQMVVLPQDGKTTEKIGIMLYGSARSRELGQAHIESMQARFEIQSKAETVESHEEHKSSGVGSQHKVYLRVDELPTPRVWSIRSFRDHVSAIVNHRHPRLIERHLYPGTQNFDSAAAQALTKLFLTPELSTCFSAAALKHVLEFFCQRTQFGSHVLKIWNAAIGAGILPDAACFNAELERAITVKNTERISYLIGMMEKTWLRPDGASWALVLKVLPNSHHRRLLVRQLLDHKTDQCSSLADRRAIAESLVATEFRDAVHQPQEIHRFASWMYELFGDDWITQRTVLDMIKHSLHRESMHNVQQVLDLAESCNVQLEESTWYNVMDAVRRTEHVGDMIMLFKLMIARADTLTAQKHVNLLFKAAWRLDMYNTSRLLWRYAATHGIITYEMQEIVSNNLARNQPSKSQPPITGSTATKPDRSRAHKPRLAAWTVDLDFHLSDAQQKWPELYQRAQGSPMAMLCEWTQVGQLRDQQLQLAHFMLDRSLTAWKSFQPVETETLIERLDEAYLKDKAWEKSRFVNTATYAEIEGDSTSLDLEYTSVKESGTVGTGRPLAIGSSGSVDNVHVLSRVDSEAVSKRHAHIDSIKKSDGEPNRSYNLFTEHSGSATLQSTTTIPALVLTTPGIIELILQRLGLAWEAV